MEMMQFHPTCLYNLDVKNFLITEAVRGEGGILKHPVTGRRYMPDYDARAELAPRDIVARANDDQIKRSGLDYVHLDISHQDPDFVAGHFPNIYEKLLTLGIDMTKQPIRSEEHTSELQSLMRISYAVFCLKKKKTKINNNK